MATVNSNNINNQQKIANIIDKHISDLEELSIKLIQEQSHQQELNGIDYLSDDCYELQKFCAKLEFLIQFRIKEKKTSNLLSLTPSVAGNAFSPSSNSNNNSFLSNSNHESLTIYTKRDYWHFFCDVFKSSRAFQDALKYAKSLSDVKTDMGRARAFIRFCLQYHRLADAIQQMYMDEKFIK
jgi:hypothetical protein